MLILGVFSNVIDASLAITNLETEGIDGINISALMKDGDAVETIAQVSGPLTGAFDEFVIKKFAGLGLGEGDIDTIEDILRSGGILIVVSAHDEEIKISQEVLESRQASLVRTLSD